MGPQPTRFAGVMAVQAIMAEIGLGFEARGTGSKVTTRSFTTRVIARWATASHQR
jgi:hypothetical protein